LANTGLNDIAKVDFFNNLWVDFGLVERMFESNNAEFRSGETFKSTVE
jgi:hypothetical protein